MDLISGFGPLSEQNHSPNMDGGQLERCHRATCAVCKREETIPHRRKEAAAQHLRDLGWKQTTRLSRGERRLWICPVHHESGSYAIYRDKETDRTELGAGDIPEKE